MDSEMKMPEMFGSMVFNDAVMRDRLPKEIYKSLRKTIAQGKTLDVTLANVIAHAMKEWALEKGATHFTHWFQPMTGITAEKHDSFVSAGENGSALMSFSGKELIRGEPDASSFPSGGLRATFEARGYTAWDPTSYAFVKGRTLYIPTVFYSYSGEVLDKKTPLLRSIEVLSAQAIRLLRLFGDTETVLVQPTIGAEQEYFLVDRDMMLRRRDLVFTGRTLFGARPPKGQDLGDHYFGTIKPRVADFMNDLNRELWKLGIYAKTEHNEAAPSQHELAPLYETANTATDHNQLTMEMMKTVANKKNLACLLHEKPFEGINGSGKHNNWSLETNRGENLFEPGAAPASNKRFLLFFSAVIKAVDEHQDLLRLSTASASNDCRLGSHEAPPAIISMFLGDDLTAVFDCIKRGVPYDAGERGNMNTGVHVLPNVPKDTSDRNRTSPFAFTGNKFEFRMLGSSFSIAGPNIAINTMIADVFEQFADRLEKASDFDKEVDAILRETITEHDRIIFNGNNYSEEWEKEAEKRGLLNLRTAVDAIPHFADPKNVALFEKHKVFSRAEVISRTEILLDNYCKMLHIEACTMRDMARQEILPAVIGYISSLSSALAARKSVGIPSSSSAEEKLLARLTPVADRIYENIDLLCEKIEKAEKMPASTFLGDTELLAALYRDEVLPVMKALRAAADEAELLTAREFWPFPTYGDLLFGV